MAVSYKPLMHMMIERDISNAELMRRASISANIITKIKNGRSPFALSKYIVPLAYIFKLYMVQIYKYYLK